MNAVTEAAQLDQSKVGLYNKFNVTRTDGSSEPGGKHHGDEYFVLNLTTDKHVRPALTAYAKSCAGEFPALAADLRAICQAMQKNEFVPVPETTLPDGTVVPAFHVGKYFSGSGDDGQLVINASATPWTDINYYDAVAAAKAAGLNLITELQALAIAHDIANVGANWSGGAVGVGNLKRGLHKGSVDEAQPGDFVPDDAEEDRWFTFSNGSQICDAAGNLYTWVHDNVQGDEQGIMAKPFADNSPSITTAPFPSMEKGVGWQPKVGTDWSGGALIRGGFWYSGGGAGAFYLGGGWPDSESDCVGFRCTKE